MKNYTQVELLPTKFSVGDIQTVGMPNITLDQLDTLDKYHKVSLKIIEVSDPVTVSTGKRSKQ